MPVTPASRGSRSTAPPACDTIRRWQRRNASAHVLRLGQTRVAGDSAGGGLAAGFLVALCGAGRELPAAAALRSPWCDLRGLVTGRLAATGRRSPPRGFLAGAEGGENDVDCLVAMPGLQGLSAYH